MGSDGYRVGHLVIVYDVRLKTNMASIVQLVERLIGIPVFILALCDMLWASGAAPRHQGVATNSRRRV